MDDIIARELELEKLTVVEEIPDCVHALGAILKSDGGVPPVTDCRRPLGVSIKNYMNEVCREFSYISLDQVTAVMTPGCFFSILDIKSAYCSVSVFPDHRRCQGLLWDVNGCGVDKPMEDNCLCFGLKSAPFLYTQLTEFIMRTMS